MGYRLGIDNGGADSPGQAPPGSGSRGKLVSIIAGILVLVGVGVGVGFQISGRSEPPAGQSPTGSAIPSSTPSASPNATATSSGSPTSSSAQKLPSSTAIPESEVIVPMRFDSGPDRPLYLVDTEGKIKQAELPTPEGGNSNPIMQASRNTIIYANAGELREMAPEGPGDG